MKKVMLVTGGSRGIGAATARMAAAQGYDVAIAYAGNLALAEAVAVDVRGAGGKAITLCCDVAVEDQVVAMVDATVAELGGLDVLVNSAGIVAGGGPITTCTAADVQAMLAVNVLGTILCSREAVKRMSKTAGGRGGAIVNLSSVAARLGGAGFATAYAASKGAIDSFTIGLGREVASQGIRVNAVTPGPTETDMNPVQRRAAMAQAIPIGRLGEPEEIAAAILWLASDAASFTVAANIDVTGGR